MTAMMKVRFLKTQQPKAALDYIENFAGDLPPETKLRHIELLLAVGKVKKAAEVMARYMSEPRANINTYVNSYSHILYDIQQAPETYRDVQATLTALPFSEQARQGAETIMKIRMGDWQSFVQQMDKRNLDIQDYINILKEDLVNNTSLALSYAIIKKEQGESKYAQYFLSSDLMQSYLNQCKDAKKIYTPCPGIWFLDDSYDLDTLLQHSDDNILHSRNRYYFEKRYLLTSPYWYMLHEHPGFKPMAEKYLDNTFRKWRVKE